MNHVFTRMVKTLKRRSNHPNGWAKRAQDPKSSSSSIECRGDADSFYFDANSCCSPRVRVPQGSTVNQIYCTEVLKRLGDAVR